MKRIGFFVRLALSHLYHGHLLKHLLGSDDMYNYLSCEHENKILLSWKPNFYNYFDARSTTINFKISSHLNIKNFENFMDKLNVQHELFLFIKFLQNSICIKHKNKIK